MATQTPELSDFLKGDPAQIVLGRSEEKPARRHGRQKPKPPLTARGILELVKYRKDQLEPVVEEYKELLEAKKALKGI